MRSNVATCQSLSRMFWCGPLLPARAGGRLDLAMSQVAYTQVRRVTPAPIGGALIAVRTLGILASCLIASACNTAKPEREWRAEDHGQPLQPEPSRAEPDARDAKPVTPEEAQERAMAALWNVTCAGCHGRDGRGGGAGLPPGAPIPDLTDTAAMASKTDDQLAAVIRDGRGMMPPFGPQVGGDEGVRALVAHVRKLVSKAP